MGRPVRLKAPDVTYHITSRTNGGKLFLQTKRDRKMLCRILNRILLKYDVIVYSFTTLTNHFHLVIHIKNNADLSQIMCEFKSLYAKYFNRRYHTSGHFWGERFKSTVIQDDRYALACLRYIDRNALKAGLVRHPAQWPLSSFACYAYGHAHPILQLKPHPSYLALAKTKERRRKLYADFVLDKDPLADELHGRLWKMSIFGSEEFIARIRHGA